jgi:hypothetical protein
MLLDLDDELTLNQGATAALKGQLVTATAIGGRQKGVVGQPRDWGAGEPIFAYFAVTPAANSNPTTSRTVDIVAADDAALTTNQAILSTRTVVTAQLLAGRLFGMPALSAGFRRAILGCRFTPNGGAATTGAYVCGLVAQNARVQDGFLNL